MFTTQSNPSSVSRARSRQWPDCAGNKSPRVMSPSYTEPTLRPAARQRRAMLRKALVVALRELPESEVILIIANNWLTLNRLDTLKERFP